MKKEKAKGFCVSHRVYIFEFYWGKQYNVNITYIHTVPGKPDVFFLQFCEGVQGGQVLEVDVLQSEIMPVQRQHKSIIKCIIYKKFPNL